MKAQVYYVKLTDQMYDEINANGWECETGRKYLAAKAGKNTNLDEAFDLVGEIEADNAEQIWMRAQHAFETGYFGSDNRSMDVGDIVIWEDGRIEQVASCGFNTLDAVQLV